MVAASRQPGSFNHQRRCSIAERARRESVARRGQGGIVADPARRSAKGRTPAEVDVATRMASKMPTPDPAGSRSEQGRLPRRAWLRARAQAPGRLTDRSACVHPAPTRTEVELNRGKHSCARVNEVGGVLDCSRPGGGRAPAPTSTTRAARPAPPRPRSQLAACCDDARARNQRQKPQPGNDLARERHRNRAHVARTGVALVNSTSAWNPSSSNQFFHPAADRADGSASTSSKIVVGDA